MDFKAMSEMQDILVYLEDHIVWSKVKTNDYGHRVRTASPTKDFWDYWRDYKEEIKNEGYRVFKDDTSNWVLSRFNVNFSESFLKKCQKQSQCNYKKLRYGEKLRKYQKPHTLQLVNSILNNGYAIDASDMGTGKTYTGAVTAMEIGQKVFIICGKNNIIQWRRVADYMGLEVVDALSYGKLRAGKTKYATVNNKKHFKWHLDKGIMIIFDEAHHCSGQYTLQSNLLVAAKYGGYNILMLSATLADNPLQMRATGFVLDLFELTGKGYDKWCYDHGVVLIEHEERINSIEELDNDYESYNDDSNKTGRVIRFKKFSGTLGDIQVIHNSLYPLKGSRMRIDEILEFPETQITAECYSMNSAKKIDKVYVELQETLNELCKLSKAERDKKENKLTMILRARQEVELLKLPTFSELVHSGVTEGNKVAVFLNFTESIKSLKKMIKKHKTLLVYGEQTAKENQVSVDSFQSDSKKSAMVIIANIQSGGESLSLHDLTGKYRRLSVISPTYHARALIQCTGRVHRDGGLTKSIQRIIFTADSIEEKMAEVVTAKINRMNTLNDGDLRTEFEVMYG